MGSRAESFDTPCPLCAAADAYRAKATKVALLLLVIAVAVVGWKVLS